MIGIYCSTGEDLIEIDEGKKIIGPIFYLNYPNYEVWLLQPNCNRIIIINNDVIKKEITEEWKEIEAFGFKGFSGDFISFGICDEINIF